MSRSNFYSVYDEHYNFHLQKNTLYADDTTIVIKRTEQSLRNLVTIIKDFAKISGLHANLEKTHVIPIRDITSIEPDDQICKDLKLNWTNTFTLLGFEIDSELNQLNERCSH